jgi:predicted aspartyl protease
MHAREHSLIQHAHEIDPSDPDVRKEWMRTLSVNERIKSMEDYLAQPTTDDADTRRAMTERLDFLKAYVSGPRTRCRPTSDLTATDVDLAPIQGGRGIQGLGLLVELNAQTSRLLLDTGASGILISRKLADQAHLQRVSDVRISGIGDKPDSQGQIESAETVRIGKLEFHDCPVRVVDHFSAGQDGIIGADVFSQFLIEMDFPSSKLRLSELPRRPGETLSKASLKTGDEEPATESEAKPATEPGNPARGAQPWDQKYYNRYIAPEMEHYVQAFLIDHMLLIPTKINQGPEKLFLLDSGSFDNTITPDAARAVTKVHKAPKVEVRGLNGNVKDVYVANQVVLDFGHLRQTVPNMVAFDLSRVSRRAGTEVSGTLGMVMLELLKVRLDYRDALADFQYVSTPKRH